MSTPSRRTLRLLHVLTDAALVSVGWLGAYAVRRALDDVFGVPLNPFAQYVQALPLVVLPWIAACWCCTARRGLGSR